MGKSLHRGHGIKDAGKFTREDGGLPEGETKWIKPER